jgi:protein O-mannosyl-transferase
MLAPPSRRPLWFSLLIAGLTFTVFVPVLRHAFLFWDDNVFIFRNSDLNPPRADGLAKIWGHPIAGYHQFYVPVTYTVWWIVAHFARAAGANGGASQLAPMPFHALNLAFHTINAALVFLILRRLVKSDWAAALGALLFALHPLQVDPVSWAANMYTSLSALFSLLAILTYLYYSDARAGIASMRGQGSTRADADAVGPIPTARTDPSRSDWKPKIIFFIATICFALALLTKPAIILLPFSVAVIELLLRNRRLRDCAPLLAWVALAIIDALITRHAQTGAAAYQPALWQRPLVAADALAFYICKTLLPFGLIPDYARSPQWVLHQATTMFIWVVPLAMLGACWTFRRKCPWLLCGAVVFVLGVFPMLGLVPFDYQKYSTVADRYVYFSLFGAALIAAFAVERLSSVLKDNRHRFVLIGASGALLVTLTTLSVTQARYWEHTGTLFTRTLDLNPRSLAGHVVLGYVLMNRGNPEQLDEALAHFLAAAEIDPADAGLRYNSGIVMLRKGNPAGAGVFFRQALSLKSDDPSIGYMLGSALAAAGDRRGAIAAFLENERHFPNFVDTDLKLAQLLASAGDTGNAALRYQQYLGIHPDSAQARRGLNQLHLRVQQAATDQR